MKTIIIIGGIFSTLLISLISGFGQVSRKDSQSITNIPSQQKVISGCPENIDKLYNRNKVLERLADILNESVPEYSKIRGPKFGVKNERGKLFFVYDLVTPSNKSDFYNCIEFKNKHIYHFAPSEYNFSYSHILILEDGNLKIFKSIDCGRRGDKLEDVISYLNPKLMNDEAKDEIISRVKNFRKYGQYFKIENPMVPCEAYESEDK